MSALLVFGLLTGCGGGDEESLTKAEFSKQASKICEKGLEEKNARLLAALQQLEKESKNWAALSRAEKRTLVSTELLPPIREMYEELAALGTPEQGAAQAEEIVEAFEAAIAEVEKDPESVLQSTDPFAEVNKRAVDYGLEFCGEI